MFWRSKNKQKSEQKIIDIDTGLKGTFKFTNPVTLRVNGSFEGELDTIGNIEAPILVINEGATLKGNCQMPLEEEKPEPKEKPSKKKK